MSEIATLKEALAEDLPVRCAKATSVVSVEWFVICPICNLVQPVSTESEAQRQSIQHDRGVHGLEFPE